MSKGVTACHHDITCGGGGQGRTLGGLCPLPNPNLVGANRPSTIEMVGAYGGAKSIGGEGDAKPKNLRGAEGAAKIAPYTLVVTFYCIFKNKFSKNGQF